MDPGTSRTYLPKETTVIIEVTYANEGQATIDLDPSTFRKVTIDPERPLDTRVRVAFKDGQEPLDLFFLKDGAPEPNGPLGPFVTYVTVFRPGSDPVVLTDPVAVYATLSNLFLHGEKGTGGTDGTEDTEGKGATVHGL
jgi:hypothetical protein